MTKTISSEKKKKKKKVVVRKYNKEYAKIISDMAVTAFILALCR